MRAFFICTKLRMHSIDNTSSLYSKHLFSYHLECRPVIPTSLHAKGVQGCRGGFESSLTIFQLKIVRDKELSNMRALFIYSKFQTIEFYQYFPLFFQKIIFSFSFE